MASHTDRIRHHTENFNKVLKSFGPQSHYTTYAFFQMQAALMGKSEKNIRIWAESEMERLKAIALEIVSEED
ncbi:hypothetical protein [Enterovibrio norvegicus]|uniref:hypothetical protein n=1 Tax=Enterovibrio norvegicus TaxID=188144 RepID=UPI00352BE65A